MKKLMLLIGSLLCGTVAYARPQLIEPVGEVARRRPEFHAGRCAR